MKYKIKKEDKLRGECFNQIDGLLVEKLEHPLYFKLYLQVNKELEWQLMGNMNQIIVMKFLRKVTGNI